MNVFSPSFEDWRCLYVSRNDPVEGKIKDAGEARGESRVSKTGRAYLPKKRKRSIYKFRGK